MSPDLAQRLQTMAHDLANEAQGIEQLKISQEQMVRDIEAVGEQLKAALSQMNRDNAAVGALKTALSQMTRDNVRQPSSSLRQPRTKWFASPPPERGVSPSRRCRKPKPRRRPQCIRHIRRPSNSEMSNLASYWNAHEASCRGGRKWHRIR
jgi:hypothetical protein